MNWSSKTKKDNPKSDQDPKARKRRHHHYFQEQSELNILLYVKRAKKFDSRQLVALPLAAIYICHPLSSLGLRLK